MNKTNLIRASGLSTILAISISVSAFADQTLCDSTYLIEKVLIEQMTSSWAPKPGKMVKISNQVHYVEIIPATYQTITEKVIVQNASTELITIPAVWGWVEGEHPGFSQDLISTPPEYEIIQDKIYLQEEIRHMVSLPPEYKFHEGKKYMVKGPRYVEAVVPAITKEASRKVLAKPSVRKRVKFKNIVRHGKTYQITIPASTVESRTPPLSHYVVRRIVKTPARSVEKVLDEPLYKWVPEELPVTVDRLLLRNIQGQFLKEFRDLEELNKFQSDLSCEEMAEHFSVLTE